MSDNITLPRKHIDYAAHALEHFNKDAPDPLVSEIIHHLRAALAALDAALAEPKETFAESLFRRSWEAHRAALAEPEQKPEPATREQVFAAYDRNDAIGFWNYCYAWRAAERFHGIRKEDGK